jgi:galactoside O-acetyltransferase
MSNPLDPGYFTESDLRDAGFKSLGSNVRIARNCTVISPENIEIGSNVRIDGYCSLVAAGAGNIRLGSFIHVAAYCLLSAGDGIVMEDFSGLSQGVRLYTRSDDYSGEALTNPTVPAKYTKVHRGPIVLKRHVIVGSGSVILPGVTVGEGSAVGALSLVTKDLAGWGVYFGCPAKRLKDRSNALLALERQLRDELAGKLTPGP